MGKIVHLNHCRHVWLRSSAYWLLRKYHTKIPHNNNNQVEMLETIAISHATQDSQLFCFPSTFLLSFLIFFLHRKRRNFQVNLFLLRLNIKCHFDVSFFSSRKKQANGKIEIFNWSEKNANPDCKQRKIWLVEIERVVSLVILHQKAKTYFILLAILPLSNALQIEWFDWILDFYSISHMFDFKWWAFDEITCTNWTGCTDYYNIKMGIKFGVVRY